MVVDCKGQTGGGDGESRGGVVFTPEGVEEGGGEGCGGIREGIKRGRGEDEGMKRGRRGRELA